MSTTFTVCALVMSGWVSHYANEPVAPTPQTMQTVARRTPSNQATPRYTNNRPARMTGDNSAQRPRMPFSPTDPRAFSDNCMPLPPTMDSAGPTPSAQAVDARQRFVDAVPVENANRRAANDRPFANHQNPPAVSPYMLLYSSTANGTISTYNAYVRPALTQRAAQEEEEFQAAQGTQGFPSIYLSRGLYNYPSYPVEEDRQ